MIRAEYLRFLQTLNNEAVSADIRKIANQFDAHENIREEIIKLTGKRCKNHSMIGSYYCRPHQPR